MGGGHREEELLMKANTYNGRLVVTGLVEKSEVEGDMKEIDVLMVPRPSTLETETAIPLKLFDSVESGKPVIISDVFGLKEVLGEREAFLYNKNDIDGLYKSCLKAYKNQFLCDEKYYNAVKKLSEWPTWAQIHERQFNVFEEALRQC